MANGIDIARKTLELSIERTRLLDASISKEASARLDVVEAELAQVRPLLTVEEAESFQSAWTEWFRQYLSS